MTKLDTFSHQQNVIETSQTWEIKLPLVAEIYVGHFGYWCLTGISKCTNCLLWFSSKVETTSGIILTNYFSSPCLCALMNKLKALDWN